MRAYITKHGMLKIESENQLETYALNKWLGDNPIVINSNCDIQFIVEEG